MSAERSLSRDQPSWVERLAAALYRPLAEPDDDDRTRLKKTLFLGALVVGMVMTTGTAIVAVRSDFDPVIPTVLFALVGVLVAATVYALVSTVGLDVVITVVLAGTLLASFATTYLAGGIMYSGVNIMWGIVTPVVAFLVFRRTVALAWFAAFLVLLYVAVVSPRPAEHPLPPTAEAFAAATLSGIAIFVFGLLVYFLGERDKAQQEVEYERSRSDALLANILPNEIASRLKQNPGIIADAYPEASVLFADIADFTPMSESMSPEDLVTLLNETFSEFDRLVDEHGVEKIKTIGDCYMAASGVPEPRTDHAEVIARLALDMRRVVSERSFHGQQVRFRIGINSGPLVAGVIGTRKFIYDLWGDTVNTASRMESHGIAGTIQLTEATRRLLPSRFVVSERGMVQIKGKGELATYFLEAEDNAI